MSRIRGRLGADDDRGDSTLLLVACVVALILAVGLVVDGSARLRADDNAQFAAEQAGRAAAQEVAVGDYRDGGRPRASTSRAVAAAQDVLAASGIPGDVRVLDGAVVVDTTCTTRAIFLAAIGITEITGRGHAEVALTRGLTQGGQ